MSIDKDVLQLIFVTERIQTAPLRGEFLSDEQVLCIRECAAELLEALPETMPDQTLLLPFVTVDCR
jgi:hypothetical protein